MLSVRDAKSAIFSFQKNTRHEFVAVDAILHRVLAKDFLAPFSTPPFSASAMDGYALLTKDTQNATPEQPVSLQIIEHIHAGAVPSQPITSRHCARIMTGSPLPQGADAVVMQESVEAFSNTIRVTAPVTPDQNIRHAGEEFACGDLVLPAGTRFSPAQAALLASFGVSQVPVFTNPKIVIIPTGSELAPAGRPLNPGEIYESSCLGLRLALTEAGLPCRVMAPVIDDPAILHKILATEITQATHILLCGGVSVGDADYSKSVLENLGVKTEFWKIAQKPGKPFYFGHTENSQIFGLPGNPVSTLLCFYEYVLPALNLYRGWTETAAKPKSSIVRLGENICKPKGRTDFIRARLTKNSHTKSEAWPLKHQGSHRLSSLAFADGWIVAEAGSELLCAGKEIEFHEF